MPVARNDRELLRSGREAIEVFSSQVYDVVLLDWGIPGIRAREVMSQLVEIRPESRIFLMTGDIEEGQRMSGAQGPILGVFRKPFSLRNLADALRRFEDAGWLICLHCGGIDRHAEGVERAVGSLRAELSRVDLQCISQEDLLTLFYENLELPELSLMQKAIEWGVNVKAVPGNYQYYGYYSSLRKEIALATREDGSSSRTLTSQA